MAGSDGRPSRQERLEDAAWDVGKNAVTAGLIAAGAIVGGFIQASPWTRLGWAVGALLTVTGFVATLVNARQPIRSHADFLSRVRAVRWWLRVSLVAAVPFGIWAGGRVPSPPHSPGWATRHGPVGWVIAGLLVIAVMGAYLTFVPRIMAKRMIHSFAKVPLEVVLASDASRREPKRPTRPRPDTVGVRVVQIRTGRRGYRPRALRSGRR